MSMMAVPIIYDAVSKNILRWYILDNERQFLDPAFNPQNAGENIFRIPMSTYKMLSSNDLDRSLLGKLQEYVNGNAP